MPCDRPDCQHRPKRPRKDRPRCKSCARSASMTAEMRDLAARNMTSGRRKHLAHLTDEQANEYRWLTNNKHIPAAEAIRIATA